MTFPLVTLATASVIAGVLNLPFSDKLERLGNWLHPVIVGEHHMPNAPVLLGLASGAITAAVIGILVGYAVYEKRKVKPSRFELPFLARGWYIDESYTNFMGGPGRAIYQGTADFDAKIVDGVVNGVGKGSVGIGRLIRPLQSGIIRSYAFGFGIGAVLLLVFVVTRMSL